MLEPLDKQNRIIHFSFRAFMCSQPPIRVCPIRDLSACVPKAQYKDHPQLWYCREGAYIHETEHGSYSCSAGSLVIVPPGVAHALRAPETGSAQLLRMDLTFDYLLDIPFDAAPNTAGLLFLPPFLRKAGHPVKEHYTLPEASRIAVEETAALLLSGEQDASRKRAALEQMLSLPELALPEHLKKAAAADAWARFLPVLRVLSYIQANYSQKITAEQLCQASSLCRTNLFRLTGQYLGISWATYLVMYRVIRANYALIHTNYSIAYIADMCGFTHSSHMSSCYKRYKGILPKDDRQKQLIYQKRYGKLHITHEFFMDDFFG